MGGFGILEKATPEQLPVLLDRGAKVDVWSAAKFGMADRLRAFLDADPSLVERERWRRQATAALCRERRDRGAFARPWRRDRCARRRPPFDAGAVSRQRASGRRPIPARAWRALRPLAGGGARRRRSRPPASRRGPGLDPDAGKPGLVPDDRHRQERRAHLSMDARLPCLRVRRGAQARPPGVLDLLVERAGPLDRLLDALWNGDVATADAILASSSSLVEQAPANARGWSPTPPATTRPLPSKPCSRGDSR